MSEAKKMISVQVSTEAYNKFKELHASDTWTQAEVMTNLIEKYFEPIKIKEGENTLIVELKQENASLKLELEKMQQIANTCDKQLQQELTNIGTERDELKQQVDNLINNSKLPDNTYLIEIDKLNYLILQHVAKREGEKRNQAWTVDDVINYFIHFRFEKGSLNGDLKSVSDNVIEELKKQI